MNTLLANSSISGAGWVLLAEPSLNYSWAIVLFFIILGNLVTLSPAKRTYEIKKAKES